MPARKSVFGPFKDEDLAIPEGYEPPSIDERHARSVRGMGGGGLYRRITVHLKKIAPGHFQVYATRFLGGSNAPAEHLGGVDVHDAWRARATMRRIARDLEVEFPDHNVELVT